jgi:pimeloyl-ACP methyl ester carboxylesterase
LFSSFIRHKVALKSEENLRKPLGDLVEVEGNKMSIYTKGQGKHTLVFLSGGGTSSPILDFKPLYSKLFNDYRIVVVEKFGYGYSDVMSGKRDIETILRQTRTALEKSGIKGPYVLCPHSMSGIEAIHWAQMYPNEVEAIIGLDMAVPGYYEDMKISMSLIRLGEFGAMFGLTRWIPGVSESDAIKFGTFL